MEVSGLAGSAPIKLRGAGAFDYANKKGRLEMELPNLGLPGIPAGAKAEMIFNGNIFYMRYPGFGTPAKPWLKVDIGALSKQSQFAGLDQMSNDPAATLDTLRGVSGEVNRVGTEKVRGVETTHYRATLDMKKAAAAVPPNRRATFDRFAEQLDIATMPMEVWVDGDGRTRKMSYSIDLSKAAAQAGSAEPGLKMAMVVELYDFGVKVDATPPPATQVNDAASLTQP